MEPFKVLEPYRLIVCTACRHTCLPAEVATHLQTQHRSYSPARRREIAQAVQAAEIPYYKQGDLSSLGLLLGPAPTIAELAGPFPDGLGCRAYRYIVRQPRRIREHCRTAHG